MATKAAPKAAAPNDKVFAGGTNKFDEKTGQPVTPPPAATPPAAPDMKALEAQRAKLEMEMKRSAQGSDRQKAFADKLAAQRTQIQNAKTAAGQPLKNAQGVTGQQMVDTLGKRAEAEKAKAPDYSKYERLSPGVYRAPDGSLYKPPGGVLPNSGTPAAKNPAAKPPAKTPPAGTPPAQTPPTQEPPKMGPPLQGPPEQNPNNPQQPGGQTPPGQQPPVQQPPGQGGPPSNYQGPSPYYGGFGNYGLPGMYSQGWGGMQAPNMPSYNYQQGGQQGGPQMMAAQGPGGQQSPAGMTQGIYDQATGGTLSQFDTAANRLRERLDASTQGAIDQNRTRNIGRGFGNSGVNDAQEYQIGQGAQDAYAQGLNSLSQNFEQLRQQGLNTALGAANTAQGAETARNQLQQQDLSQLRNLNNSNFQFQSGQDLQNRQFMDQTLFNLINNREGRGSAEKISGNELAARQQEALAQRGWQSSENALDRSNRTSLQNDAQQFEGGQNNQNRQLQQQLQQLQEQNNNWRSSLGNMFNVPGLFNGTAGGGNVGNIDLAALFGGGGGSTGGSSGSSSGGRTSVAPGSGYTLGSRTG